MKSSTRRPKAKPPGANCSPTGNADRRPRIYSHERVDVIFEQPYGRIADLVEKGIAQRQAASRDLKDLAALGVLQEIQAGKEKLFIHPKLMQRLTRDSNDFASHAQASERRSVRTAPRWLTRIQQCS